MNGYSIPKATLGRLPLYLEYLRNLSESHRTISATAIANGLSLGEVQVRKDLAAVSGAGKPKVGYECDKLISDLERHLGYEKLTNAVLVGAGKLGRALLDYDGFEKFGVKIVAGFDCKERVIQMGDTSKSILPIKNLKSYCKENEVKLGIITVGQASAQDVCDKLVECGITAIWNFAPCILKVPSGVLLKQENLALSLAHLKSQLS
ncbi:MAG: redox-sensing transcriptional repressor Rex [Clostridia bacterium]|nr:redox-sensing transcriptional repressor Rex [Clostridia bacterium]MBQ8146391.1 redox-sensing transcriptional repressor Rex [Clostridia bacterium]